MSEGTRVGTCGCGRSPTGDCVGWHRLSDAEYAQKVAEAEAEAQKEQILHNRNNQTGCVTAKNTVD